MVCNWIMRENYLPFLRTCASFVGYSFDEADSTALRFGLKDCDDKKSDLYRYEFAGLNTLTLEIAAESNDPVVTVRVEADPEIEAQVEIAIVIMQEYVLVEPDHTP